MANRHIEPVAARRKFLLASMGAATSAALLGRLGADAAQAAETGLGECPFSGQPAGLENGARDRISSNRGEFCFVRQDEFACESENLIRV